MKRLFYTFLVLTGFSTITVSQQRTLVDDTLSIQYALNTADSLEFENLPYYELNGFQQYRPLGRWRLPMARSGNIGLGVHSYQLDKQDWDINYQVGAYQPYLMVKDSMRYYKMSRPFTQMRYANGTKKEQIFNVFHSQNIGEGLNISFEYQKISSNGYYLKQLTNHTQFNSTFNLHSRNKRFNSKGYFLINTIEAQENGGILVSEVDEGSDNTISLDINLDDAQNRNRTQSVGVINQYDIWKLDSLNTLVSAYHEISWSKSFKNYQDRSDDREIYYDSFFIDSLNTLDSSYAQNLSNLFGVSLFNDHFTLRFKNEQYYYFQNHFISENFSSDYIVAGAEGSLLGTNIHTTVEKGLSGFFKNELDWVTHITFKEWKGIENRVSVNVARKQPDYFLQNQRTNHRFFQKDFNISDYFSLELRSKFRKRKGAVVLGIKQFTNYVYFDTLATPQQHEDKISSFFIELNKKISFLKYVNLLNRVRFQTISNSEIIPLPELFSYHSLYYENRFFQQSLRFQIGFDVFYIGKYRGYEYAPFLSQFYLRNQPGDLGNTIQADLFMNIGINKSARVFVKMENINSSSFSRETYRIQDYPIPGRSFKIGLSWRMVN